MGDPQAYGNERGLLGGIKIKNVVTGEVSGLSLVYTRNSISAQGSTSTAKALYIPTSLAFGADWLPSHAVRLTPAVACTPPVLGNQAPADVCNATCMLFGALVNRSVQDSVLDHSRCVCD
jgi:hypothetical protein